MKRYEGKTAIVTGGVSGIGEAITLSFLKEGANVVINCLPGEEAGKEMAEKLKKSRASFLMVEGDISKKEDVENIFEQAKEKYQKIDIVVSNAAAFDFYQPLLEIEEATWKKVMDVNLNGNYYISRSAVPHMIENGGGALIFISSIAGVIAGHGGAAYTTSKHGVIGLSKQITFDYGKYGIRCNTISPGSIYTPLSGKFLDMPKAKEKLARTPHGTYGHPQDIANAVLFLAGEEADFVYGTNIMVDGGNLVRKWD